MALRHPDCACATKNLYFSLCKKRRGKGFSEVVWQRFSVPAREPQLTEEMRVQSRYLDLAPSSFWHRQSPAFQPLQNNNMISSTNYGTEKNNHAPKQNRRKPIPQGKYDRLQKIFFAPFFWTLCISALPLAHFCRLSVPTGGGGYRFSMHSNVARVFGIRRVCGGFLLSMNTERKFDNL